MATGNLIKKKEEFELWLKSQIAKGCDLLKREVSEDDTTIVRYRTIVKIKEYDEDEKRRATFVELVRKECPNRLPYSIQHTYFLPCTREIPRMPIPSENSIVNKKDRGRELQTNRKPCASKFESHPYAPPVEAIRTSRHDSR